MFLDGDRDEVFAANHGNWTEMRSYAGDEPAFPGKYIPGRFQPSSIRVYKASANGDVPPIRTLQGNRTQLAWPMGITVDKVPSTPDDPARGVGPRPRPGRRYLPRR